MPDAALAESLADERAEAIRALLAVPLLDAGHDGDAFRLVVRHHGWLAEWFETACGWRLTVDAGAGFARLAKRPSGTPDPTRPLRRLRGTRNVAFDRRRYQLLCLVCAELVRHPVITVGLLAQAVTADAGLESSRRAERTALVDALLVLLEWGVLRTTSADPSQLEAFVDDRTANAILTADTTRLHQLLCSAQAPSALDDGVDALAAIDALCVEPRYGSAPVAPEEAEEDQRLRWVRHSLARRTLDDPVVHLSALSAPEADYLANPSGRRWLRDRVVDAALVLEERADGLLAVDPSGRASDLLFPAPAGNAAQLALLLIDRLVRHEPDSSLRLTELRPAELSQAVDDVLRRFPAWASSHREGDGPQRLVDAATDLLVATGLCRVRADGTLVPLPAVARYRVAEPVVTGQASLFEEVSCPPS